MNNKNRYSIVFRLIIVFVLMSAGSCSYITQQTISTDSNTDSTGSSPEPNYDITLDYNYQDFVSYFYMGNRIDNFTAYFNTFYRSQKDFDEGYDEYRSNLISQYNRRLDSLGFVPPISASVKDKLDKAIERSSKIIQFSKNTKYIDEAVMIIGKSYYYQGDYFKAERTFNEFLSKFSSSILADEAILFLGQTKIRLGKKEEGEKIFKSLSKNADEKDIKSLAFRNLGIIAFNKGKTQESVDYFQESIDYAQSNEKKAEEQFILAKILSVYKPELAANEYREVLDYTSDFDLTFFANLNYAKGLIVNKKFSTAKEVLEDLRKKYRDEAGYTQLVDLEIANNYYSEQDYPKALEKYYEIIVKYPNTTVSSDSYYFLGKYEEDVNKNYVNAFVNYKKATEENINSDYIKESEEKSVTYEKYFTLEGEIKDSGKVNIPTTNAEVEKYRVKYNDEKGIEQVETGKNGSVESGNEIRGNQEGNPDGTQTGDGKGKPGGKGSGKRGMSYFPGDDSSKKGGVLPGKVLPENIMNPDGKSTEGADSIARQMSDTLNEALADSMKAAEEISLQKAKEDKRFNAYYGIAELFIYNMNNNDSAEYYLKLLLSEFKESDKQTKILYTLANFYKNTGKKEDGDQLFQKIISTYPNTVYANESRKILGQKIQDDIINDPVDAIFSKSIKELNRNKYTEAISELQQVEIRYPQDSLVAKSLYAIGWIYENKLSNKDSSLLYYKKLRDKYPETEYTYKVAPMLDYLASLEVKNTTDTTSSKPEEGDSTQTEIKEEIKDTTVTEEVKKPEEEVKEKTASVESTEGTKLSQEEIDRLLKETENDGK